MARIRYPPLPSSSSSSSSSTDRPKPPPPNISRLLSHSTSTAPHWGAVANAQFTKLQLDPKLRELAVLLVTAKLGSTYEHTHHTRISGKFGVTDGQRAWIAERAKAERGVVSSFAGGAGAGGGEKGGQLFTEKEATLLVLVENVIERAEVDERLWGEARRWFGERELVEVVSLVGFYFTFARLTTVFQVELDDAPKAKL